MAQRTYTSQERAAMNALVPSTFANPAMQTSGWTEADRSAGPAGEMNYLFQSPSTWQAPMAAGNSGLGTTRTPTTTVPYTPMPTLTPYTGSDNASLNRFMGNAEPRLQASLPGLGPEPAAYAPQPPVNPAVAAATQAGQGVAPPFPASVEDRLNARAQGGLYPGLKVAGPVAMPQTLDELAAYNAKQAATLPSPQSRLTPETQKDGWTNLSRNIFGAGMNGVRLSGDYPVMRKASPAPVMRSPTGAAAYDAANAAGRQAAQQRQTQATGQAGGFQYQNGQRSGYAPVTLGNGAVAQTFVPTNGAQAYGLSNAAGQIRALDRQATATGQTGVYNYNNGVRGSTVNGQSGASAYDAANRAAQERARAGATRGSTASQSFNDWAFG